MPSATRSVLDEEATADLRAEQRLWLPALAPASEPAFDLALVVDDSESMALWGEKVREFRLLCERLGAFRDVRPWRLAVSRDGGQDKPVLHGVSRTAGIRSERELLDPSGRRLTLVVTDGVHPWWQPSGPLGPVLARWALASPLAIVQPFPQRLWGRSPLRPVIEEFRPGWPGSGPTIRRTGNGGGKPGSVAVPVLELTPAAMRRWAGIISGITGTTPLPAAVLLRESAAAEESPGAVGPDSGGGTGQPDPVRLVRDFRASVSPAAFQLAGYLSAAPLTLPVMRLVQESMMRETGPAELAEVVLSGLLRRSSETDVTAGAEGASYVFAAGVREVLQSTLTRSEALSVLDQVGSYLVRGRQGGKSFPVILDGQSGEGRTLTAFGRISSMLLRRIGGPYAEVTRQQATSKVAAREEQEDTGLTDGTGTGDARGRHTLIWGSETPFRNPHFTGREAELQALRAQLQSGSPAVIRQPPGALFGLGGVGKTQIATEYAHRYAHEYEVVWWVRADQEDAIQASLVALGTRLHLPDVSPGDRDRSFRAVIDALQAGDPSARWLLIFDDVREPQKLSRYIPRGGHVIVTSRISEWQQVLGANGIEVKEFARADTVKFLRDRVPQLIPGKVPDGGPEAARAEVEAAALADQLAEVLGDLPLAAEHAASYLSQTRVPVAEYIEAFRRDAHTLLGLDVDMFSANMAVATTWSVSRQTLRPEARELFQLLAFFAAEPISEENLIQPGRVALAPDVPAPLVKVLSSRVELKRAQRELARFSLISIYGQRNVVQMHRVVQAVTKARIEKQSPKLASTLRETVFSLLAALDPESPEREQNDPVYERSIHHLVPTGALDSQNELLRNLIINQVRRLRMRGGYREALSLGEAALGRWRTDPDDIQTLAMTVEVAIAMRLIGRIGEAFALNSDALQRLRDGYGEDDDIYLICASSYGEDLRLLGRYDDALAHDLSLLPGYDRVFSPGQFLPLSLRHDIAVDLRCVGRFEEALAYDSQNAAERERYAGTMDWQTVTSKLGMTRDLLYLGRYEDALASARDLADVMDRRSEPWNFLRLDVFAGLSVSLRRAGYYAEACDLAEEIYRRYVEYAGEEHRATLVMATNLMCDRRVVDDLVRAGELGEATVLAWDRVTDPGHPNALTARANLAVILRMRGYPAAALEMNQAVMQGFRGLFPYEHPSTLIAMTNLASDLAAVGDVRRAREIGEEVLAASREVRGPAHPATLAASANLTLDLRATGVPDAARDLEAQTLTAYDEQLSPEHPQTFRARQHGRINVDITPAMI